MTGRFLKTLYRLLKIAVNKISILLKKGRNKMTNADKIRNMTDEEIAKWYVINCNIKMNKECPKEKITCFDCILQWLKSEAND